MEMAALLIILVLALALLADPPGRTFTRSRPDGQPPTRRTRSEEA